MSRVRAPTLVIEGSEDRLVPLPAVRRLVNRCPGFELEVFQGVGHVPMMETPDRFLAALQAWLDGAREARAG
jgi:pimeloyl-ACP methyl ester carboxylesterase